MRFLIGPPSTWERGLQQALGGMQEVAQPEGVLRELQHRDGVREGSPGVLLQDVEVGLEVLLEGLWVRALRLQDLADDSVHDAALGRRMRRCTAGEEGRIFANETLEQECICSIDGRNGRRRGIT